MSKEKIILDIVGVWVGWNGYESFYGETRELNAQWPQYGGRNDGREKNVWQENGWKRIILGKRRTF